MSKLLDLLGPLFNRNSTKELGAIGDSIDQTIQSIFQTVDNIGRYGYNISTATGVWLKEWGSWFKLSKTLDETDESYSSRIRSVPTKPKVTINALLSIVHTQLGNDILAIVDEPFSHVFVLSGEELSLANAKISTLCGKDKFASSEYNVVGVIDVLIYHPFDSTLQNLLFDSKGAGIKLFTTQVNANKTPISEITTLVESLRDVDFLSPISGDAPKVEADEEIDLIADTRGNYNLLEIYYTAAQLESQTFEDLEDLFRRCAIKIATSSIL